MNLRILTIVLDGIPFLPAQLAVFNRLKTDWKWYVVEGVADNVKDTSWCAKMTPRLSTDGTTEFLNSLRGHPRIKVYQQQLWPGKTAMCNHALQDIKEPCLLMQIDADELWTSDQLERIIDLFSRMEIYSRAYFFCRYFVGNNVIVTTTDGYGNRQGEWLRAFRFAPGNTFEQHEPPVLLGNVGLAMTREFTRDHGLVFDHYSWVLPQQVFNKSEYYGYKGGIEHWQRLQANRNWPVKLKKFFHWADDHVMVDRLFKT